MHKVLRWSSAACIDLTLIIRQTAHENKSQLREPSISMELGVTGTAVGIASLGIQVCEKLHDYYAAWRDCPDDVASNISAIESLRRTFELFEPILAKPNLPLDVKQRVEECLVACSEGVDKLKRKFDKFGSMDKFNAVTLRLQYPFRRSTLLKLSETVGKLLGHLDLALQLLGVGLQSRSYAGICEARNEIEEVAKCTEAVREAVDMVRAQQKSALEAIASSTETLAVKLNSLDHNSQHLVADVRQLRSQAESTNFRAIVQWIAAPDVTFTHDQACRRCHVGTGQWFLESAEYLAWKSDNGCGRRLWLHGMSGCCKTVLVSTIIEDLRSFCDGQADRSLAYFYFTFSNQCKQSWDALLRALVLQLSQGGPAVNALSTAFELSSSNQPTTTLLETALKQILTELCADMRHVYIVIDALDECPDHPDARVAVYEALADLTNSFAQLHVLFTSRWYPDIEHFVQNWRATASKISPAHVDTDIDSYVAHELETGIAFRGLEQRSKNLIATRLSENTAGMFRWATLQLDHPRTMKNKTHLRIEETLNRLPPGLAATYERMLSDLDEDCARQAMRGLTWLALSIRPLTLEQVAEAICVDPTEASALVEMDRVTSEAVLEILSGLVQVEPELLHCSTCDTRLALRYDQRPPAPKNQYLRLCDSCKMACEIMLDDPEEREILVVRLAHASVRDYVLSGDGNISNPERLSVSTQRGRCYVSRAMAAYLIATDAARHDLHLATQRYPLLHFSMDQWLHPTFLSLREGGDCACGDQRDHSKLELALLNCENIGFGKVPNTELEFSSKNSPSLLLACIAGCRSTASSLVGDGAPVDGIGVQGYTALHMASLLGRKLIVQDLLANNAAVNTRQDTGGTALHLAATIDRADIVDILMSGGADASLFNNTGQTPLYVAADQNHPEIVSALLDHGVDVDVPNIDGMTALWTAYCEGHLSIIERLLVSRPALEFHDEQGRTVLWCAAFNGSLPIVERLLAYGASVHTVAEFHTRWDDLRVHIRATALDVAKATSSPEIAQLLEAHGAVGVGEIATLPLALRTEVMKGFEPRQPPGTLALMKKIKIESMEDSPA
ncbi:hypothetical protein LTR97_012183 [Elasticomyces elasticus]|uniref:Nephrocystin 3-like N-terminal domain-containing protein n=1 Tax=Elasticomyces elasticus TaxID=574655 RepID=A0AAN7VW47_9PEZI|nr:hypothetical protein LTR97_012183 [Elasticomyces elasticus]